MPGFIFFIYRSADAMAKTGATPIKSGWHGLLNRIVAVQVCDATEA